MKCHRQTLKWELVLTVLIVAGLLAGCAGLYPKQTPEYLSYSKWAFPSGTQVLGLVDGPPLTRDEIMHGARARGGVIVPPLYETLLAFGYRDEEITSDRVVLILHSVHWHSAINSSLDATAGMKWAIVPNIPAPSGKSIVEIEIRNGIGRIVRVQNRQHGTYLEGDCEFREYQKNPVAKTIDVLNIFGGPGSRSLDCPGLEAEGWVKQFYGLYGEHVWTKLPKSEVDMAPKSQDREKGKTL